MATTPAFRTLRRTRGWVALDLPELVHFRDLLVELARRDIKLRYRQTVLGIAWVVIQPLFAAGVLTFAFGIVAGLRPQVGSSFLFTYAGLLMWNVFSWTLSKTSMSMVGNAFLVSKVYFPRLILPLSGTLSTLLDLAFSLVVFAILLGLHGVAPGPEILFAPVWIALAALLALGAGLAAAAMTVLYRDVQHVLPVLIPFLLYASPVAYEVSQIPDRFQRAMYLANPLAALIGAFRWSVLGMPLPPVPYLVWSAGWAVGLFVLGAAVFRRIERRFADVI